MTVLELLGRLAVLYLREQLPTEMDTEAGTARYALDCLGAQITAAIGLAVLADPFLSPRIEVKLPGKLVGGSQLPPDALTDLPATHFRNATCTKSAFLLANVGDEEQQSLQEAARVGSAELLDRPDLWVRAAADDLALSEADARWWEKALAGLRDLRVASLERFAGYVLRTRAAVAVEGLPLVHALGAAMPALRLPRDQCYFLAVKEGVRGRASAWKAQFSSARTRREGLLVKQTSAQLALGEDELRKAFDRVRDVIPAVHHGAVETFIAAPAGWNEAAAALAECEWEDVKPLFDGLQREKFNLGRRTLEFYEEGEPGVLSEDDRQYLERLSSRRTTEASPDDVTFYESRRTEFKEDRKLKSAWDRFVYGRPFECADFLVGLASSLEPLINRSPPGTGRRLRVRCDRATKRELRDLNVEAGTYFALRYAGLRALLGERVTWDVGQLFEFPNLLAEWRAAGSSNLNRSQSKAALQLRFNLELETDLGSGGTDTHSAQLVWVYESDAVVSQFASDWERLETRPLTTCRASREQSGARARASTIDLSDVRTLVPAFDRDRGSFIPVYKRERDLGATWRTNLAARRAEGKLTETDSAAMLRAFEAFETAYGSAIREFRTAGAGSAGNLSQARAYADLLQMVVDRAPGDINREGLLRPLLQIGTAVVDGGSPASVVLPWHPLRLAAAWRKAQLIGGLVRRLVEPGELLFGDTRLFFKDVRRDLGHPFYPEVVLGWSGDQLAVLAATDFVQDYSLHESPVAGPDVDTNESPADGAATVIDLVRRYLALHPHERANMAVVLFNCDSARLPQAVIDRLGSMDEDGEDTRCQLLLRHVDPVRLRDLYRSLQESTTTEAATAGASEAAQDFMSRLRISVAADEAPPPDPRDGRPYDIVFSQDVVSRHARLEWLPVDGPPAATEVLLPSRWSRRRPAADDDLKSASYLCCPVQGEEGWAYLDAVARMTLGDAAVDGRRLVPARQLDFRDERTARIFEETHNLANWVANYDELLDRRQLLNQRVRIIRFRQTDTYGRNLVVSSSASLALLRSMVGARLRALNLDLDDAARAKLVDRMIDDANEVSGDIVLRAARRGRSASELIGLVLSRYLVRKELGDRLVGWYFLDDYAAWLGQREEHLADLLALAPSVTEGGYRLDLIVSEAKYVHADATAKARRDSQKQLRETLLRMTEALHASPARMDRDAWLGRLADLLIDGIRVPAASGIDLASIARAVREGRCEIAVRGYSHVFVPDPADGPDLSAAVEVPGLSSSYQETYGRARVRELVASYALDRDPSDIRRAIGMEDGAGSTTYTPSPVAGPSPEDTTDPIEPSAVQAQAGAKPVHSAAPKDRSAANGTWADPEVASLLAEPEAGASSEEDERWLKEVSLATRSALQQLRFQAKSVSSTLTPNSALLKFAGTSSLTVEQVVRRRSELLTTYGLNVVSVRAEPGAVALAVERPRRQQVGVRALWSRWQPPTGSWGNQDLLVGVREDDNELLVLSPGRAHAPHTLIAGSTGSGKSVLMQNLILGIAATNTPEQARIVLVDPKQGVDYFAFDDLPHLDGGVIDNQDEACGRLQALVAEMDARYARFKAARVNNLAAFNAKVAPTERLPVIWLIHDEFAEWMLVEDYKREVSSTVGRLGVKARAAGIHLIFAAQRPDANVMPMQLRANLGNRLILRVDSEGTSEISLGEKGAERLLGKGHVLAKVEGERDLCYAQVPFVDEAFIERIVATRSRTA
ncbi:FtsK/SpoIIIE domain-containing protein [Methylobacterium sp. NPDC080182]|uniref:FtsK/SpoIIIE domain-containing protein n=1 Tax=Methylobacterium sp. NPDC080182 TaxID=3390590 RepID=UPI003CFDF11B